jgi:hypothetical protein
MSNQTVKLTDAEVNALSAISEIGARRCNELAPRHPRDAAGSRAENQRLNPHTANVHYGYDCLVGDGSCVGRVYFWYDPAGLLPAIEDSDFRPQHPEITDSEWDRLFYEAFDRGQTEFEMEVFATLPESELVRSVIDLGRRFGPRKPRSESDGRDPQPSVVMMDPLTGDVVALEPRRDMNHGIQQRRLLPVDQSRAQPARNANRNKRRGG